MQQNIVILAEPRGRWHLSDCQFKLFQNAFCYILGIHRTTLTRLCETAQNNSSTIAGNDGLVNHKESRSYQIDLIRQSIMTTAAFLLLKNLYLIHRGMCFLLIMND